MEIRVGPHTLERAEERGTDGNEIKDVVETGFAVPAKHGRMAKAKVYEFGRRRHGKFYDEKRVEVIYTVEGSTAITVTVYVFYGKWEEQE
ncbi:MAG: hypothetical protein ABIK79_06730 [Chloroflexota bacterium]